MSDDVDHGQEAQRAAEAHLEALDMALEAEYQIDVDQATDEREGHPEVEWPDSAGPYCGCQTCVIRETLWAAWPHLRQAALEGAE